MFATPMKLPKSRTLGVSFSESISGRKLDDSSAGCPSTCNGRSCDQWEELFPAGTMTCELAEASYGCDCSGCDCNGRDGTAAPVPSPSTAPVPGPTAQPTETLVPTVFSTAMPTTLYNYKYKQCFDLYGAPYTAFPSFEPTRFDTPEPTMTPAPTVSLRPPSFVALGLPPPLSAASLGMSPDCIPQRLSTHPAPLARPILCRAGRPRCLHLSRLCRSLRRRSRLPPRLLASPSASRPPQSKRASHCP